MGQEHKEGEQEEEQLALARRSSDPWVRVVLTVGSGQDFRRYQIVMTHHISFFLRAPCAAVPYVELCPFLSVAADVAATVIVPVPLVGVGGHNNLRRTRSDTPSASGCDEGMRCCIYLLSVLSPAMLIVVLDVY